MKSYSGWVGLGLLGPALGLLIAFAFGRPSDAQSIDNKTTRWLAGTVEYGQAQQAFMLFDAQTNRLMAYTVSPMKEMELIGVREISYDLKMVSYGKQKPTVKQVMEDWEREEREKNEKKK